MFYDETSVTFYENTNPVQRAGLIVDGLLELFGFRQGVSVKSFPGLLSMGAVLLLIVVTGFVCSKIKGFKSGEKDFLFLFFASSFAVNTLVFLVGGEEVYDARYYFPVLIMLVPLAAGVLSDKKIGSLAVLLSVCFRITGLSLWLFR